MKEDEYSIFKRDYGDKPKFEKHHKGIFELIKKYPECIEICPSCGNIVYSNFNRMKGFKESNCKLEFEINSYVLFICGLCKKTISGQRFLEYKEETTKMIKNYILNREKEKQNFYDFFYSCVEPLIVEYKKSEIEMYKLNHI
jgi:hypothetical protein